MKYEIYDWCRYGDNEYEGCVLYDEKGKFIMKHNIGYDLHTPNVDVSEENRMKYLMLCL